MMQLMHIICLLRIQLIVITNVNVTDELYLHVTHNNLIEQRTWMSENVGWTRKINFVRKKIQFHTELFIICWIFELQAVVCILKFAQFNSVIFQWKLIWYSKECGSFNIQQDYQEMFIRLKCAHRRWLCDWLYHCITL